MGRLGNAWKNKPQEKNNKYNAVWLSNSSSSDFLKCPRLYYLRNVLKSKEGRKMNIVSKEMTLGSLVHSVIEPLAKLPVSERFNKDLFVILEENFQKFKGKKGGFLNEEEEMEVFEKSKKMIENVIENKGPINNKTVKYYDGDFIPNIYLSEEDNIILCGLVDWIEYLEESDTLRVIDFKTGKNDEKEDSMQLPIYKILVEALQKRKVTSSAYWYLARDKEMQVKPEDFLSDEKINEVKEDLLEIGREIKKRKENVEFGINLADNFKCAYGGRCVHCKDFEDILEGKDNVEFVGISDTNADLYLVKKTL